MKTAIIIILGLFLWVGLWQATYYLTDNLITDQGLRTTLCGVISGLAAYAAAACYDMSKFR